MYIISFLTFWLLLMPSVIAVPSLDALFQLKKVNNRNTGTFGGCSNHLAELKTYLSESRELVQAGLQAFTDAANPSAKESKVAKRYLKAYFNIQVTQTKQIQLVKGEFLAAFTAFQVSILTLLEAIWRASKAFWVEIRTISGKPPVYTAMIPGSQSYLGVKRLGTQAQLQPIQMKSTT